MMILSQHAETAAQRSVHNVNDLTCNFVLEDEAFSLYSLATLSYAVLRSPFLAFATVSLKFVKLLLGVVQVNVAQPGNG